MKLNIKVIIELYLIVFIIYSFFLGGMLQFFFGFSNTIITFFSVFSFLIFLFLSTNTKINKIKFEYTLIIILLVVYAFIVSLINKETLIKPILYSLFFLVPLVIYYMVQYGSNEISFLKTNKLKRILLFVAIFQLPILLIQKYFYSFLIKLNLSSQYIAHVDFTFGSFFLKNDHALGFFLVANLLYIWSYPILKNKNQRNIVTLILLINLLLSNSNTSILYLFGAFIILIFKNRESITRIPLKKFFFLSILVTIIYLFVDYFEPKFYLDLQNRLSSSLNYKSALKWYEKGLARREQIVVVLLENDLDFIGHGAYAYFDIIKGKFTGTFRHFSQLIWLYYDLGLIGLTLFLIFIFKTNNLLKQNKTYFSWYLTFGLLLFSFFSIVTFDINFMLTYFIYKYRNEY